MNIKTELLDEIGIERALRRISHEIIEFNKGVNNLVLLGIARGGVPICMRLAENIKTIEKTEILTGEIAITNFRDDKDLLDLTDKDVESDINFSLQDKDVVLCDDVLFTGRSVRAAIESVFKLGRPRSIQLAVLIDRGHRELPIRADYVGKNVPTSKNEEIIVKFDQTNGNKAVIIDKLK